MALYGVVERWSDDPAYQAFGNRVAIKRILAIKADHIGDFVLSLAALHKLRQAFPDAHLCLACGRWNAELARSLGIFDEVHPIDFFHSRADQPQPPFTTALLNGLDKLSFDLAIDIRVDADTRVVLTHIDARYKCGFDAGPTLNAAMNFFLPHSIGLDADRNLGMHQSILMQRLVHTVCDIFRVGEQVPKLLTGRAARPSSFDLSFAEGRVLVLCSTASGRDAKNWPFARFRNLIGWMCNTLNAAVLIIGGPDQKPGADRIISDFNLRHLVSAAGQTTLAESIWLLGRADLFIGNDTGVTHIAARIGVPTISINSGIDPTAMWAAVGPDVTILKAPVPCSPCHITHLSECRNNHACILDINEDDVKAVVRSKILAATRARLARDLADQDADLVTT